MSKKVLIVEDENIVALGIKKILRDMGYLVPGIAATGQDAIDRVEKTFPDLVLMDITLKGSMTGIETADYIMKKWNIPVIYITAYSDQSILDDAEFKEPAGYIRKPFTEAELKSAVLKVFNEAEE
ncbi:MAG: response regulator [Methanosarcinaceae archaeon]|nr:response regulator [Methanosarcinaceae archaeon]